MNIRRSTADDGEALIDIWLRSVRATHSFLSEADIQHLHALVRGGALDGLEVWVLCDDESVPMGFMGLSHASVQALFLSPEIHRRGYGRKLIEHAVQLKGQLTVDVNEQNPAAVRFYEACGFTIEGRSELDGSGLPFPILHMRQSRASKSGELLLPPQPKLHIRPATESDLAELAQIYISAVELLGPERYTAEQVRAWATSPRDDARFHDFILKVSTYAAEHEGRLLGFCGLGPDGYVASLYVHGAAGRKGIGSAVLHAAIEEARQRGMQRLHTDASEFSRPLFAKFGFTLINIEQVTRVGVVFQRYRMQLTDLNPCKITAAT